MITRIRKIGNSSGILLSKTLLNQCEIIDQVVVEVKNRTIVIKPVEKQPREGWEKQFIEAGALNDNENILGDISTKFEEEEWTW
ncbi:MAG: hypothetical protein ACK5NK_13525 [Niabella sp.]